jgi:hypothetical protein
MRSDVLFELGNILCCRLRLLLILLFGSLAQCEPVPPTVGTVQCQDGAGGDGHT